MLDTFWHPHKLLYNMNPAWALKNFCRIFESQLREYRAPRYKKWEEDYAELMEKKRRDNKR